MKKYFVICAALLAVACSQKDVIVVEEPAEPQVSEETLPAGDPAEKVTYIKAERVETKASINNTTGVFTWNAGDRIAVYAGGYKISDELSGTYDNQSSATFAFSGTEAFDDGDRANFAVYPAGLVCDNNNIPYTTDVTASSLKVNLPASYTLAQVQGELAPVPMIAANAPAGGLVFKNICALVRLTVNNISKDANTLKITFPGKKVQGEFTLTGVSAGTTATVTANTSDADDTITITDLNLSGFTSGLVISVPVPTGVASSLEYGDVVVGAYDSAGNCIHYIYTPIKATAWVPTRTSAKKVTVTLPVFSVSASKKVVFAPGNLQAVLGDSMVGTVLSAGHYFWGASSWQFAPNQYTIIGNTDENRLLDPAANQVVDLFSWIGESRGYSDDRRFGIYVFVSGSGTTGGTGNVSTTEAKLADWGANVIGPYPANTWYTLASSDWEYVLTSADRTNTRFTKVLLTLSSDPLTTINGIIIFPDQYTHPISTEFTMLNRTQGAFADAGTISLADLSLLEHAGCAFLPAAGIRTYNSGRVVSDNEKAVYWTTTPSSSSANQALTVYGTNNGLQSGYSRARYYGCAVRLVRDVN